MSNGQGRSPKPKEEARGFGCCEKVRLSRGALGAGGGWQGLLDLEGLQAGGTNVLTLDRGTFLDADLLQVRVPAAPGSA